MPECVRSYCIYSNSLYLDVAHSRQVFDDVAELECECHKAKFLRLARLVSLNMRIPRNAERYPSGQCLCVDPERNPANKYREVAKYSGAL